MSKQNHVQNVKTLGLFQPEFAESTLKGSLVLIVLFQSAYVMFNLFNGVGHVEAPAWYNTPTLLVPVVLHVHL